MNGTDGSSCTTFARFRSINLSPGRYVQVPPCLFSGSWEPTILSFSASGPGPGRRPGRRTSGFISAGPRTKTRRSKSAWPESRSLEGALKRRDEAVRAYGSFSSLWSFDRVAYYKELERFVGHVLNAAAAGRNQLGDGKAGSGWTARHRARLNDLPLNRDEIPAVFFFPPEKKPGLERSCPPGDGPGRGQIGRVWPGSFGLS